MQHDMSAYGLWSLVIINSLIFIIFAFSFAKPKSPRRLAIVWRLFGLRRSTIHRDVRVPADYLPAIRLAPEPVPEAKPYLARRRPPVVDAPWH
jgi:hypothetical protein